MGPESLSFAGRAPIDVALQRAARIIRSMLKKDNEVEVLAAARLLELVARNAPWHRSLWSVGISLGFAELLEASVAAQAGILSDAALRRLTSSVLRLAGSDPVLTDREKSTVNEQLRNTPRAESLSYFAIQQLGERVSANYLLRWARYLEVTTAAQQPEVIARSVAAYLLDSGFSDAYLHSWFKGRIADTTHEFTLADLCREAHDELACRPQGEFEVLVAFENSPRSASGYPARWLNRKEVSEWLRSHAFATTGVRATGAVVLRIAARDPLAAADSATSLVDGYLARATIASGQTLTPWPVLWIAGHDVPVRYAAKQRGVRVKAIYREDQVFSAASDSSVDAAIELLAHLESSSPAAAIAGGWAAIEALLAERADRAAAADNLAALVACSLPRAELTHLSYSLERGDSALAERLQHCQTNRDRAEVVAEVLFSGQPVNLKGATERSAAQRMQRLLRQPDPKLARIKAVTSDAFHRLYRQRNLILHGGITNSIAINASLRTASKLAGAGMDRIAHGFYVQQLRPLELAARATLRLVLGSPADPKACVGLLEA